MPPQNRYDVSEAVSPPATTTGHVRVDETEATALMLHQSALVCGDARRALQLRRSGGSGPRHSLGTGDPIGLGYGSRILRTVRRAARRFSPPMGVPWAALHCSGELPYRNPETITAPARLSGPVRLRPGGAPWTAQRVAEERHEHTRYSQTS